MKPFSIHLLCIRSASAPCLLFARDLLSAFTTLSGTHLVIVAFCFSTTTVPFLNYPSFVSLHHLSLSLHLSRVFGTMNEHLAERFGRGKQRQQQQQRQERFREGATGTEQVEVAFLPPRLNAKILKYEEGYSLATGGPHWLNVPELPDAAELASDGPRDLPCNRLEGAWETKGASTSQLKIEPRSCLI
jgi:hypothetical protein